MAPLKKSGVLYYVCFQVDLDVEHYSGALSSADVKGLLWKKKNPLIIIQIPVYTQNCLGSYH